MTVAEQIGQITETRSGGIDPLHGVTDHAKLGELTAAMDEHGWQGAPILADGETALTGSHRIPAAHEAWVDIPRVQAGDVCALFGADWDEIKDGDTADVAYGRLLDALPTEVIAYLGIQA